MRNIDTVLYLLNHKKHEWDKGSEYLLHYELGKLYREKSDFIQAVKQHKIARSIAIEGKDTVSIITASNQLGTDFRRTGELAAASEAHFYALKTANAYSKKNTDEGKKLRSFSLNGIGNIYKSMNNGKEAFRFFKQSTELDSELNNFLGLAMNYVTIGSILEHQDKADSALFYYKKAMHYDSLANSETGIAICHNRIGQLLFRQKKWDKALSHYHIAREILESRNDIWNKLKTEKDIAYIYIQQKKYKKAKDLLLKLNQTAKERKMFGYLTDIQYSLGLLYGDLKQYKKSSEALTLSMNYNDSLEQTQKEQSSLEVRVKFEKDIKEQHIHELNEINKSEKEQRRIIILASIIILSLLLLLSILLFYLLKTQQKHNLRLKESNILRDKIFSIVSHDLKNPAIAQRMVISNLNDKVGELDDSTVKEYYKVLQESTENQISVIENLMSWASIQSQRMEYSPQMIDVVSIINAAVKLYNVSAQQKSISIHLHLPDKCVVFADKQMISVVFRNLINNAIKFSRSGGKVSVSCQCQGDKALFSIADEGLGMSQKQIESIYTAKAKINPGTSGEKGTGLGLILCKSFLEYNNSNLLIKGSVGKGTEIQFSLAKTEN